MLTATRLKLVATSRLRLRTVNCVVRVMFWMVETVSTRCSKIGPRCNEQPRHGELLVLRALVVARLDLAATRRLG